MSRPSALPAPSRQRGAFLVMMALMVVVLIAVAAFALDFGRVVALRAEMQNAVDAAALAGAVELDGKAGARDRAMAAAREALAHDSHYARIAELLGTGSLPDTAFTFFCIIGSENDVDDSAAPDFCPAGQLGPRLWDSAANDDAHYIRVRLDPALLAEQRFTVDLIFLPVLRVFGLDPMTMVSLTATATAGRHTYTCNYPPMLMCDPFEPAGKNFRTEMVRGQAIILREQGGGAGAAWAPGNFGFLQPRDGGHGANVLAEYLAAADAEGCDPARISTKTGEVAQKTKAAINTRFDMYDGPTPFKGAAAPDSWPPAPNIVAYPTLQSAGDALGDGLAGGGLDDRFGNGQWDFDAYWAARHGVAPKPTDPVSGITWSNSNRPTRAEVYRYEVETSGMNPQVPVRTPGDISRRELHVAVASCLALDIKGSSTNVPVMEPDGFAKMFVLAPSPDPGAGEGLNIYAEYMGWSLETDANYHVNIQLYQ